MFHMWTGLTRSMSIEIIGFACCLCQDVISSHTHTHEHEYTITNTQIQNEMAGGYDGTAQLFARGVKKFGLGKIDLSIIPYLQPTSCTKCNEIID